MATIHRNDSLSFIIINSSTLSSTYSNQTNASQLSSSVGPTASNTEPLQLVERLTLHITLIVSVIGLIGNACTIIVLNRHTMRKWRSSILLSALAGVDLLFLLIIFLSIIDELTNKSIGFNRSLILCQATVYVTHVCSFLSASFTLSFTLQRFVAVLFPLHANTIISNRSSTINILILVLSGCSFYSFSFFLTNVKRGQCQEDERYPALFPLLIVDTCLTFVIPFIFILLFNCAIVYNLRNRKKFTEIFGGSLSTVPGSRNQRTSSPIRMSKNDLYHERQRLHESNTNDNDCIPLKDGTQTPNGVSASSRKISSSCVESTRTGNEYLTRLSHSRMSTATIPHELSPVASSHSHGNRQAISQRTTKMLVICSTTFLLFNSPYCAVLLYTIITNVEMLRTLGILRHFYFMSFCLNFFLYSLCGNRFRHELILLLKTCWRKCCTHSIRSHWLRIDKIPQQSSFTRVTTRADA